MSEQWRQTGRDLLDAFRDRMREGRSAYGQEEFREGFSAAAVITQQRLRERIDDLKAQLRTGSLTKADQLLLSELDELETSIEAGFDQFWADTDMDWRPRGPFANAADREAD